VFLLLQFCTYGQLLELKLLAFLSGTLHILLFSSAYCIQINDDDDDKRDFLNGKGQEIPHFLHSDGADVAMYV